MSTHAPLHSVSPIPQARRHDPAAHVRPAMQAVPQAPQFAFDARVSTSQPLAGFMSQSA